MTTLIASAVIIISANIEWQVVRDYFPQANIHNSPLGQWFEQTIAVAGHNQPVIFLHGGWGKIAAAASAQYAINRWSPRVLFNLGTCGGLAGRIESGALVLAEKTVVYDIIEQMTDPAAAIAHFTTEIDLSWLAEPYPQPVCRTLLLSADRDLVADQLPQLIEQYGAVAGDWESGAIAWVAARHGVRCLILRGVTDLVGQTGGEAYDGNLHVFVSGTRQVFETVLPVLPQWLALALA